MSTKNLETIARLAIGVEACDDGVGVVIVATDTNGDFVVYVEGGNLPNGKDEARFCGAGAGPLAFDFAFRFAKEIADGELEDMDL